MPSVYFLDLDGTLLKHGTNDLLPGARKLLDTIIEKGGEIVITTRRGDREFKGHPVYSRIGADEGIRALGVPIKAVLFDCDSPRIVINDGGAYAVRHGTNAGWMGIEIVAATAEGDDSWSN